MRKRIETAISDIKKLFPKSIHAITLRGLLVKLTLFIFGLLLIKTTAIKWQLGLTNKKYVSFALIYFSTFYRAQAATLKLISKICITCGRKK